MTRPVSADALPVPSAGGDPVGGRQHATVRCARHLYVSRLAPELSFDAIRPILQISRARNPTLGIRGVLMFDGERFMQLLEGEPASVAALAARIAADKRHVEIKVLHDGIDDDAALCSNWRAGYTEPDALAAWSEDGAPTGRAAVDAFVALAAGGDTLG